MVVPGNPWQKSSPSRKHDVPRIILTFLALHSNIQTPTNESKICDEDVLVSSVFTIPPEEFVAEIRSRTPSSGEDWFGVVGTIQL